MGENVFSHFKTLLGLAIREKVSRNRRNGKICLEIRENVSGNRRKGKRQQFCLELQIILLVLGHSTTNTIIYAKIPEPVSQN